MNSYNKDALNIIAHEQGFIRDNLEKVIRLVEILRHFSTSDRLASCLALKGGTAINLCVFQMPRLSVDIDLDLCVECGREDMMEMRSRANDDILRFMQSEGYWLSPMTKNPHSLDSWVFNYINAGGNKDVIKIEINYSNRCHILPVVESEVIIPFLNKTKARTLAPLELFASKIAALIGRCAARDLYDVGNMIDKNLFNSDSETNLLRKGVIFYLTVGAGKTIINDFQSFPLIENIRFPQIRAQLLPVLKKSDHFNFEKSKIDVMAFLQRLMRLGDDEKYYIRAFMEKSYMPGFLFDDEDIIKRIKTHPMALWKTRGTRGGSQEITAGEVNRGEERHRGRRK